MDLSQSGDSELISKTLKLEQKLFYLDLKQNPRGQYLKISEKTSVSRSTIIVPSNGISWFVDLLTYYSNSNQNELSSKELQLDNKVFYFDVGENIRGRFLKIAEVSQNRKRSVIIIPAGISLENGWVAFRNLLVEIQKEIQPTDNPIEHISSLSARIGSIYLGDNENRESEYSLAQFSLPPNPTPSPNITLTLNTTIEDNGPPPPQVVRAEQKKFYFDMGSNSRGHYLKISEVSSSDRSAIFVPASALEQFHEALTQFLDHVKNQGLYRANIRTVAPLRKRNGL